MEVGMCALLGALLMTLWYGLLAVVPQQSHHTDARAAMAPDLPDLTNRPIIGIVSMEITQQTMKKHYNPDNKFQSYIAASYVKFIEGAGARVAPVFVGQQPEYYRKMAESVNGLLLPGGATYLDGPSGFGAAGQALYREAIKINQAGTYFPLMGICLGMELIAMEAGGGLAHDLRENCKATDHQMPLRFTPNAFESKLFKRAPDAVRNTLRDENVTVNQHKYCVTENGFRKRNMTAEWSILSKNVDENQLEFISSYESKEMPIYGLQFHPEKNIYEWKRSKAYARSASAVATSRYFADFLVAESRKNNHTFEASDERDQLIYKHQPTDTGNHLIYEQIYFFSHEVFKTREDDGLLSAVAAPTETTPV